MSGLPSTLYALAAGRDPLEATKAAGSILLPRESRTLPLVLAAVPVHLALSLGWAVALQKGRVRGLSPARPRASRSPRSISASSAAGCPRMRALPLWPQVADHAAYGAVVGAMLARR